MFRIRHNRVAGILPAFTLALVVVMVLAGAASAKGKGPVVHHVSAGGPDACIAWGFDHPGCDGNFSLEAKLYADGSVSGQYSDRFAKGDGFHAVIDCLVVDGNEAWVSGVITQGTWEGQSLVGEPVSARLRDNGVSAKDPADQISYSNIGEGWAVSCTEQPGDAELHELYDVPQGQVTIK